MGADRYSAAIDPAEEASCCNPDGPVSHGGCDPRDAVRARRKPNTLNESGSSNVGQNSRSLGEGLALGSAPLAPQSTTDLRDVAFPILRSFLAVDRVARVVQGSNCFTPLFDNLGDYCTPDARQHSMLSTRRQTGTWPMQPHPPREVFLLADKPSPSVPSANRTCWKRPRICQTVLMFMLRLGMHMRVRVHVRSM